MYSLYFLVFGLRDRFSYKDSNGFLSLQMLETLFCLGKTCGIMYDPPYLVLDLQCLDLFWLGMHTVIHITLPSLFNA